MSITFPICSPRRTGPPTFPRTKLPAGLKPMSKAWSSTTGRRPNSRAAAMTKKRSDGRLRRGRVPIVGDAFAERAEWNNCRNDATDNEARESVTVLPFRLDIAVKGVRFRRDYVALEGKHCY